MHNYKQLLDEVFVNIRNNQGRGKCYQPKPRAEADNTNRDIPDITKTESNNCFIILYLQVISQFLAGSMKRIEKPFLLRCPRT